MVAWDASNTCPRRWRYWSSAVAPNDLNPVAQGIDLPNKHIFVVVVHRHLAPIQSLPASLQYHNFDCVVSGAFNTQFECFRCSVSSSWLKMVCRVKTRSVDKPASSLLPQRYRSKDSSPPFFATQRTTNVIVHKMFAQIPGCSLYTWRARCKVTPDMFSHTKCFAPLIIILWCS